MFQNADDLYYLMQALLNQNTKIRNPRVYAINITNTKDDTTIGGGRDPAAASLQQKAPRLKRYIDTLSAWVLQRINTKINQENTIHTLKTIHKITKSCHESSMAPPGKDQ